MNTRVEQVIAYTGVTEDVAKKVLEENNNDVLSAVDILSTPPPIKGTRYMPSSPTIDDGLTDEVRSKLREARAFADILNASPKNDLRGKAVSPCLPGREDCVQAQIPADPASSTSSPQ